MSDIRSPTPRFSALYRRPGKHSVAWILVIAFVLALLAVLLVKIV
jgi:hypothetical protein